MVSERTIVVTGMGVVASAGHSPQDLWRAVVHGMSPAIAFADPTSPGSPTIPACVVHGPDDTAIGLRRSHRMDRCVQLALEAAVQAHADAGLDAQPPDPSSLGIIAGTSRGPMQKWTECVDRSRSSRNRLPPTLAANSTLDGLSGALSMALGAGGPCLTVSATCASAAYAISLAAQQIALGEAEIMVAGGADAPLRDAVIRLTLATGILGSHADPRRSCRPFDVTRDGTLIGEGAAFLVLESLESALRRGAAVHARLLGWAMAADTTHRTSPRNDGEGLVRAMRRAPARRRALPAGDRLCQRPRDRHAAQRPDRGSGDAPTAGGPPGPGGVQLDQACHGTLPGSVVCSGNRDHDPQSPRPDRPAHGQLPRPRPGMSPRRREGHGTTDGHESRDVEFAGILGQERLAHLRKARGRVTALHVPESSSIRPRLSSRKAEGKTENSANDRRKSNGRCGIRTCDFHRVRRAEKRRI